MFKENLKKRYFITYKFSNHDMKFILSLQKAVYPYKYMDG